METKLAALQLLLDGVGTGTDISSKEKRLKVQKSVYIVQAAGIKLGYSFDWYINGPYSTELTRDYYELAGRRTAATGAGNRQLNPSVVSLLERAQAALKVPEGLALPPARWMELVASVHYLRHDMKKSSEAAKTIIQTQKATLLPHYETAEQRLTKLGFLNG